MKIPALSGLAVDVKRIADALTKLAEHAEALVEQQTIARPPAPKGPPTPKYIPEHFEKEGK
jgi:hypothetical protein